MKGQKNNVQTIVIVLTVVGGLVGVVLNFIKPLEKTVDRLVVESIERRARGEAAIERLNQLKSDTEGKLARLQKWAVSHEKEVSTIDATQTEKLRTLEREIYRRTK